MLCRIMSILGRGTTMQTSQPNNKQGRPQQPDNMDEGGWVIPENRMYYENTVNIILFSKNERDAQPPPSPINHPTTLSAHQHHHNPRNQARILNFGFDLSLYRSKSSVTRHCCHDDLAEATQKSSESYSESPSSNIPSSSELSSPT